MQGKPKPCSEERRCPCREDEAEVEKSSIAFEKPLAFALLCCGLPGDTVSDRVCERCSAQALPLFDGISPVGENRRKCAIPMGGRRRGVNISSSDIPLLANLTKARSTAANGGGRIGGRSSLLDTGRRAAAGNCRSKCSQFLGAIASRKEATTVGARHGPRPCRLLAYRFAASITSKPRKLFLLAMFLSESVRPSTDAHNLINTSKL
nr:hypothetical protein Iba_chr02aCG20510 [Ipomoea batatas]